MMRKSFIGILAGISIVFALACMLSHWHPMHLSEIWNQGAQWVDFRGGGLRWFYEAERDKFRVSTSWTPTDHFGFVGFGFRRTHDGFTRIYVPGIGFDWCRQANAYRRYDLRFDFLKPALLAALCPALSVTKSRIRRGLRKRRELCLVCGYDLEGNVSGVCPECGTMQGS